MNAGICLYKKNFLFTSKNKRGSNSIHFHIIYTYANVLLVKQNLKYFTYIILYIYLIAVYVYKVLIFFNNKMNFNKKVEVFFLIVWVYKHISIPLRLWNRKMMEKITLSLKLLKKLKKFYQECLLLTMSWCLLHKYLGYNRKLKCKLHIYKATFIK